MRAESAVSELQCLLRAFLHAAQAAVSYTHLEQVAERLGVTPQAVYKWEKDIACPDVQLLSPLARLLETDLNTLFAYDTEPDKVELSAIIERCV